MTEKRYSRSRAKNSGLRKQLREDNEGEHEILDLMRKVVELPEMNDGKHFFLEIVRNTARNMLARNKFAYRYSEEYIHWFALLVYRGGKKILDWLRGYR